MDVAAGFLEERGPVLASVAVIVTSVFIATVLLGGGSSTLPLVGLEYGSASKRRQAFMTRGLEFYKKGYDLFKSTTAFRVTTLDGTKRTHFLTDRKMLILLDRRPYCPTSKTYGGSEASAG